jgi:hypothetical protein
MPPIDSESKIFFCQETVLKPVRYDNWGVGAEFHEAGMVVIGIHRWGDAVIVAHDFLICDLNVAVAIYDEVRVDECVVINAKT